MRQLAIWLQLFLGVGALGGGGALLLAPDGSLLGMPLTMLDGTVFGSYFVPGLLLFGFLGVGAVVSAGLALAGMPLARLTALGTGVALVVWISVQVALIGYGHPIQPIYAGLGVVIVGVAIVWLRGAPVAGEVRP